jgi:hypothetical protein
LLATPLLRLVFFAATIDRSRFRRSAWGCCRGQQEASEGGNFMTVLITTLGVNER